MPGRACARRRPLDRGALRRGWRSRKHERERREREHYNYTVIRAGELRCSRAPRAANDGQKRKTTLGDWSLHIRRNNIMYWIINYNNVGSFRWIMIKYKYKSNLLRWRQVDDIVIDDYIKYGGTYYSACIYTYIAVSFTQNTGNRSSILGWVADI